MNVVETHGLGKRYGRVTALEDCTVTIGEGRLVALVGPNGAGKSTLLNMVVGLTKPSTGEVCVLGGVPAGSPAALDKVAFVAQDTPTYRHLSATDMIRLTRNLNRHFDDGYARDRLEVLDIAPDRKSGSLSGGQRAQLALTLALARRPRLLVLDEPTSSLDPLARHDFMAIVMTAMAEDGVSVLLSSHGLAELERVADHLILIAGGRVRIDGDVHDLLSRHRLVSGPAGSAPDPRWAIIQSTRAGADPALARPNSRRRSEPGRVGGSRSQPRGADHGLPPRRSPGLAAQPARGRPMSTSALAAVPDDVVRHVPWRSLVWVAWRRHRSTLLATLAVLGLIAIYLIVTGLQTRSAWSAVRACTPERSNICSFGFANFQNTHSNFGLISALFIFAPLLIGAFVGAPLIGRELETGTYRYVWTQGAGRNRWALATIVFGAVVAAAFAGGLGALSPGTTPLSGNPRSPRDSNPANSPAPVSRSSAGAWRRTPSRSSRGCSGAAWCRRSLPPYCPCSHSHSPHRGCACITCRHSRPAASTSSLGPEPSRNGGRRPGSGWASANSTRSFERPASNSSSPAAVARTPSPWDQMTAATPSRTWLITGTPSGRATSPVAAIGRSSGSSSAGLPSWRWSPWQQPCCSCSVETPSRATGRGTVRSTSAFTVSAQATTVDRQDGVPPPR